MSNQALAFLTGLFGSLHCVAMCGPLVMSLPLSENAWWFNLAQRLLYQLGRILTYSVFGFLAGLIGSGFNFLDLQQALSLISGLLLVIIAVYHFAGKRTTRFDKFQYRMVAPIASRMGKWLAKPYGGLFAGTLHGLLPCGMVYMAIAASLNTSSPVDGSKFMFFFGLGTTPLLLLASLMPLLIRKLKAPKFLIPILFLVSGFFLISRGLNLDIPYISLPVNMDHAAPVCK